jgi:carbon storage regulator
MLILSRKTGDSILVGENIRVKILGVTEDNTVKIGIEAPKDVTILREEIYEIYKENTLASKGIQKDMEKSIVNLLRKEQE